MSIRRRTLLAASAAAAVASPALAQNFPRRAVQLVVAFPPGGSTDVGDVSWVVPVAGFTTACWVPGTPGHSWQAVACGGTTIGKKGMNLAARTLAATAYDLFADADLRAAAKAELTKRLDGRKYEAMLEKDQPPPLDYRDPPKRNAKE